MQDHAAEIIKWMRRHKLEYGRPVLVQNAIEALGLAPLERALATRALEQLKEEGVLKDFGARYQLTMDGFNRVYPETEAQCIESVEQDIARYMAERSPDSVFSIAAYSTVMRSRLNPKEVEFANDALHELERKGFWTAKDRGSYQLTQAGTNQVSKV